MRGEVEVERAGDEVPLTLGVLAIDIEPFEARGGHGQDAGDGEAQREDPQAAMNVRASPR